MTNNEKLHQFRQKIYQNFNKRADTMMDLLDALCSNQHASSVVELTLNPAFRRHYSALYKALAEVKLEPSMLSELVKDCLPKPQTFPFWLFGLDVTSYPRRFAPTVKGRSMVYQPNQVAGNKPVTIGHRYSTVGQIVEKEVTGVPWMVTLATERVDAAADKEMTGARQIDQLMSDKTHPFHGQLCVEVGDTSYSKPAYLTANRHHRQLVTIARLRSNRVLYCSPESETEGRGHPTWYGARFKLNDPSTWDEPAETLTVTQVAASGKVYRAEIKVWHDMRMRGKRKPVSIPMHQYPFTLVQIRWFDRYNRPLFKRPLWLSVVGEMRSKLTLEEIYRAYLHRSHLEHFFRFGKQKLLMDRFQTPEVEREEKWWQLVHLAFNQLWVARLSVDLLPRPWEKQLPNMRAGRISPTLVQRGFGRIIQQLGTPATVPKRRGYSPGRSTGTKLARRTRYRV